MICGKIAQIETTSTQHIPRVVPFVVIIYILESQARFSLYLFFPLNNFFLLPQFKGDKLHTKITLKI